MSAIPGYEEFVLNHVIETLATDRRNMANRSSQQFAKHFGLLARAFARSWLIFQSPKHAKRRFVL